MNKSKSKKVKEKTKEIKKEGKSLNDIILNIYIYIIIFYGQYIIKEYLKFIKSGIL
jgi:hypothetical protein